MDYSKFLIAARKIESEAIEIREARSKGLVAEPGDNGTFETMSKQVAILMSAYNKDSQKAKAAQSQSTEITEGKELPNDENKTSRKFVHKNRNKKDVQCYRCKAYGHIAK